MNVRELINQLEQMPAGATVYVRVSFETSDYFEIGEITCMHLNDEFGVLGETIVEVPPRDPPKKKKKARAPKKKAKK
jgi:hypothetical protein